MVPKVLATVAVTVLVDQAAVLFTPVLAAKPHRDHPLCVILVQGWMPGYSPRSGASLKSGVLVMQLVHPHASYLVGPSGIPAFKAWVCEICGDLEMEILTLG